MNTTKNNKLLDAFNDNYLINLNGFECYYNKENRSYHNDYNLLMNVVEKIESLNYTTDIQNIIGLGHYFRIYSAGADVIKVRDYESKIKSVYIGCVEFIQWYIRQNNLAIQDSLDVDNLSK
jgi:hypothetical protein